MINENKATFIIKNLMKELGISYKELAVKLNKIGVKEDNAVLSNRINRGTFSAEFLLDVLAALGYEIVIDKTKKDIKMSEDEFANKFLELHRLWKEGESETVYKKVSAAKERLLFKMGIDEPLVKEAIAEHVDILPAEAEKDDLIQYYRTLLREQESLRKIENILKDI